MATNNNLMLTRRQLEAAVGTDHATIRQFERLLGRAVAVRIGDANTKISAADEVVVMTSGGTATLPRSSDIVGKTYFVKRLGPVVTVMPTGSDTIDLDPSYTMAIPKSCICVVSTGAGWIIL